MVTDYRGDHMKLDDQNWHCFTLSRYDRKTDKWAMEKANTPVSCTTSSSPRSP